MPRELRNRKKSVSETKNGETKAKVVEEKTVKRKGATENDSPIPQKLQKITKKAALETEGTASPTVVKKTTKKTEVSAAEPDLSAGSDSESDEEEVNVQNLVAQIDPEDDEPAENETVYKPGQPVGVVPDVSQAVEKAAKSKSDGNSGVIYIGRVPHGFYEHEMKQYFSQFGQINKLRLSRNKKTGQSKHFAFIEFAEAATADIVAKTMNNYLLFGHILKCKTIPKEQVHEDLFKGGNKRFKKVPWNKIRGHELKKPLSEDQWQKKVTAEQKKRNKKTAALKEMGYEFEAPEIKDVPPPAVVEEGVDVDMTAIEAASVAEITETVTEKPDEVEVTVETTISAPKTKVKKTKAKKVKV